ncbi:Uncharacterized protein TCM_012364 [Theobroma cacao]|uniref:Uncharacterized protein n=1 Tax=Theobroma cacao TaxID=3641 RepID=A0A061FVY9_THECC|nr:Uncharacterized protein TCM_012364 [Theobroma cacao]
MIPFRGLCLHQSLNTYMTLESNRIRRSRKGHDKVATAFFMLLGDLRSMNLASSGSKQEGHLRK